MRYVLVPCTQHVVHLAHLARLAYFTLFALKIPRFKRAVLLLRHNQLARM